MLSDEQLASKRWLNHERNQYVNNAPIEWRDPPVITKHDNSEWLNRWRRFGVKV